MKKLVCVLLFGVLVLLLAGCSAPSEADVGKLNAVRQENIYPAVLERVDSVHAVYTAFHAPEGAKKFSYSFSKEGRGLEYSLTRENGETVQECYMEGIFYHMDSAGDLVVLFYDQTPEAYFEAMINSWWSEADPALEGNTLTAKAEPEGTLYTLTYPCTEQSLWWGAVSGDTMVENHLVSADGRILQQEIGYRSRKQTLPQMEKTTLLATTTYTYQMPVEVPEIVEQVWEKGEYVTVTVQGAAGQESLPQKVYTVPKGMACRIETGRSVFRDAAGRQSVESAAIPIDKDTTFYLGSEKDR